MANFPVKWITSAMRGAPVVSGTAGSYIAALNALLVTGWGTATANSVTVADGVATAEFNEGIFFVQHAVVAIDGVTSPGVLNGEARVISRTSHSISWETSAPDGVATTSTAIAVKYAPVGGWEVAFSGANKAVYRSTDVMGPRFCYRVDDSGATHARVVGYESMSDIDTGVGPFPTDVQVPGGAYFPKSVYAGGAAVPYILVADSRAVMHLVSYAVPSGSTFLGAAPRGWGDMCALAPEGDPWSAAVTGLAGGNGGDSGYGSFAGIAYGTTGVYMTRSRTGVGGAVLSNSVPYVGVRDLNTPSGADWNLGSFPSAVDGQLKLSKRYLYEVSSDATPRADVPGILHVPQTGVKAQVSHGTLLDGTGEFAGRQLLAFATHMSNGLGSIPSGIGLIDVTGPWR